MHTESDPLACWAQEARAIILLNDYLLASTTYFWHLSDTSLMNMHVKYTVVDSLPISKVEPDAIKECILKSVSKVNVHT